MISKLATRGLVWTEMNHKFYQKKKKMSSGTLARKIISAWVLDVNKSKKKIFKKNQFDCLFCYLSHRIWFMDWKVNFVDDCFSQFQRRRKLILCVQLNIYLFHSFEWNFYRLIKILWLRWWIESFYRIEDFWSRVSRQL